MVAALLLLSAGPSLSGDFASTLPLHAHVYLGVPRSPHSHDFNPGGSSDGDVVNIATNEAGTVVLGLITVPNNNELASHDSAPWLHTGGEDAVSPEGLAVPPLFQPPIS